jgi:ADP-ribose pyrophosphatase YjhB (NUDIX family)
MIDAELYKKIQDSIPILCIDVIMYDKLGRLFLQKRKESPHNHRYTFIGGRLKRRETIKECIKRQVDESGLNISNVNFRGYWDWKGIDTRQRSVSLVFDVEVEGEPKDGKFFERKLPSNIPLSVKECIFTLSKGVSL